MTHERKKRCAHLSFYLTCDAYDRMLDRSGMACEICRTPWEGRGLFIDHDHDHGLGMAAVRGLLCNGCNIRMGCVDAGRTKATVRDSAYVANPFHATLTPDDYTRDLATVDPVVPITIRISKETVAKLKVLAKQQDRTVPKLATVILKTSMRAWQEAQR